MTLAQGCPTSLAETFLEHCCGLRLFPPAFLPWPSPLPDARPTSLPPIASSSFILHRHVPSKPLACLILSWHLLLRTPQRTQRVRGSIPEADGRERNVRPTAGHTGAYRWEVRPSKTPVSSHVPSSSMYVCACAHSPVHASITALTIVN